jgi:hypothetical protein
MYHTIDDKNSEACIGTQIEPLAHIYKRTCISMVT